jgi:hypothetical protein
MGHWTKYVTFLYLISVTGIVFNRSASEFYEGFVINMGLFHAVDVTRDPVSVKDN